MKVHRYDGELSILDCCTYYIYINSNILLDWDLTKHPNVKATHLEKACLNLFQRLVWTSYLFTPIGAAVTTYARIDSPLPVIELVFKTFPQSKKLLKFISFNSEDFLSFYVFSFRVLGVSIFLYEAFRVFSFCLGLTILVGKAVVSYLMSVSSLTDKYEPNIILRGFKLHLKIYKVLNIIFQSLEGIIKPTTSLGIVAAAVAISGSSFVVIRLHAVNKVYFTGFWGLISFCGIILTEITMDTLGDFNTKSIKLLRRFRKIEILVKMSGLRKKLYFKQLRVLKPISIPAGLGPARFSRITQKVKTTILMYIFEVTVNLLIAFK